MASLDSVQPAFLYSDLDGPGGPVAPETFTRPEDPPSAAPLIVINDPDLQRTLHDMQQRSVAAPGGLEHGAIFTANGHGQVFLRNAVEGEKPKDIGVAYGSVALDWKVPSGERLSGSVHTHPHDAPPPSGADISVLVDNDADFLMVQTNGKQYLLVKTQDAVGKDAFATAADEQVRHRLYPDPHTDLCEEHRLAVINAAKQAGLDTVSSERLATAMVSQECGFAFYEAKDDGVFHRVDLPVTSLDGQPSKGALPAGILSKEQLVGLAKANAQAMLRASQAPESSRFSPSAFGGANASPLRQPFVSPPPR